MVLHFQESFKVKVAMSDAESAYWRLALARENLSVQKSALERSQKIYEWSARRSRLQLADQSDQLQAQAALELRKLQFQAATDDERSAARVFNSSRGIDSDRVEEKVETLDADLIHAIQAPKREGVRDDVKIVEHSTDAAVAQAQASIEADSPTFELFGTVAVNSNESNYASAFSNSFTLNQPTLAVGVRFSAPLYFGAASSAKEALRIAKTAAETAYQRRVFESDQEWKDLSQKFEDAKKRFELSRTIEQVQQKKLLYEKERLNRGRSTTFQVVQFEQEYSQAQLARIQSQADVLQLTARMKLFGGSTL
jgi:outer membrane protein TolC